MRLVTESELEPLAAADAVSQLAELRRAYGTHPFGDISIAKTVPCRW